MKNKKQFTNKGIILAGGNGTRLTPLTLGVSKQMLPIFDKPMIYYPLSVLMLAKIKNVLIISSEDHITSFQKLFGDGSFLGMKIQYETQKRPAGIPEAFTIGESFINGENVSLILGDNLFHGEGFLNKLTSVQKLNKPTIFTKFFSKPNRFGVVKYNKKEIPIKIIEKPDSFISNYAVTGLYFYDNTVVEKARSLKLSKRGEFEITDLNNLYLKEKNLNEVKLGRAFNWYDAGTIESYYAAISFVKNFQYLNQRQIACIEEIAYNNGWISKKDLRKISQNSKSEYFDFINNLINN